jgi:ABC-type multidrug transport system fused ATPase/permease subunit
VIALAKKIISLLSSRQKRQALFLLFLAGIGMLLEMLGVGLIVPILVLMTEQNPVEKYPVIASFSDFFGGLTQAQMVGAAMLGFALFYVVKVIFLTFLTWWKVSFLAMMRFDLSKRLFSGYIRLPYEFHLKRNSAELVRNVRSDVGAYTKSMIAIMDLMIDGLVFIGIFSLLFWAEPLGTLSAVLLLGSALLVMNRMTKLRLERWGEQFRFHDGKAIQQLLQGFGAVKEVKLYAREKGLTVRYDKHNKRVADIDRKQKVTTSTPRFFFEMLVVAGLSGLVLFMLWQGRTPAEIVPVLGLFAVAAFRMLPSLVRVFAAVQKLRYGRASIEKLYDDFQVLTLNWKEKKVDKDISGFNIDSWQTLQIKDVSYRYPGMDRQSLDTINIVIERNQTIGLIGGSGAGKSTLIDVILGFYEPVNGQLLLDGVDISDYMNHWQQQIGYVPQSIYLSDDTIRKNIALGLADGDIDDDAIQAAIKNAQLEAFIHELDDGIETMVGENGVRLSGGQRQRIGIARALYRNPSILVLDEATSALDVETEKEVMNAVNSLSGDKTIIIVAHRMVTVERCDYLYRLHKGKIIQEGSYDEVVAA